MAGQSLALIGPGVVMWLTSDAGDDQRYIIIGANDTGLELARRIEISRTGEKFFGLLDYRSAGRVAGIRHCRE